MKTFSAFVLCVAFFVIGALAHEQDIVRACKQSGRSGSATWGKSELMCHISSQGVATQ